MVIDLTPPTPAAPDGLCAEVAEQLSVLGLHFTTPRRPLCVASFEADTDEQVRAFAEPLAVGDLLPSLPLFVDWGKYVPLPLEDAYLSAFSGQPRHWRQELES